MSIERDKRVDQDPGELAAFGPFRLFPTERLLEREGAPVELGGRALDILIALVRQAGKVVSKTELISSIWADTTVVEGVLRTHVCSLRKTLGEGMSGARYITSVAGRGYCFVAPVVRGATEATTASSADNATPAISIAWTRRSDREDCDREVSRMFSTDPDDAEGVSAVADDAGICQ